MRRLAEKAAFTGQAVDKFVEQLILREIHSPVSIIEASGPISKAVEVSGISDDELELLVEEAREEDWKQNKGIVRQV